MKYDLSNMQNNFAWMNKALVVADDEEGTVPQEPTNSTAISENKLLLADI